MSLLALLLITGVSAPAHRLDEYLEATILSLEENHVEGFMRLVPGVALSAKIISAIDTDGDGVFSKEEQHNYAMRVLQALTIHVEGRTLTPKLLSSTFPAIREMQQGLGEVQIEFRADLPPGNKPLHHLTFENHHGGSSAVYLVNCLVPRQKTLRITGQRRNPDQSIFELDYVQTRFFQ